MGAYVLYGSLSQRGLNQVSLDVKVSRFI